MEGTGMNFKDLSYFSALAQLKQFTAVSEQFGVTQPTITYAIKRLEEEFDSELLERHASKKSVELTRTGELVLTLAKQIQSEIAFTKEEVRLHSLKKLRFGLPPIIGNYYFLPVTRELAKMHLLPNFEAVELGSDDLMAHVKEGKLDFGLIASIDDVHIPGVNAQKVASFPFVLATTKYDMPDECYFEDVASEDFVLFNEGFIHSRVFKELTYNTEVFPHILYQTSNVEALKSVVREGLGMTLITTLALRETNHDMHYINLLNKNLPTFNIYLLTRKNVPLNDSQQAILQIIDDFINK